MLTSYDTLSTPIVGNPFAPLLLVAMIFTILTAIIAMCVEAGRPLRGSEPREKNVTLRVCVGFIILSFVLIVPTLVHDRNTLKSSLSELGLERADGQGSRWNNGVMVAFSPSSDCKVAVTVYAGSYVTNGQCLGGSDRIADPQEVKDAL